MVVLIVLCLGVLNFCAVGALCVFSYFSKKVQVGKDQENAQSEKDFHSKNQGGKKPN